MENEMLKLLLTGATGGGFAIVVSIFLLGWFIPKMQEKHETIINKLATDHQRQVDQFCDQLGRERDAYRAELKADRDAHERNLALVIAHQDSRFEKANSTIVEMIEHCRKYQEGKLS